MYKIRGQHILTLCLLGIAQFASAQEPQQLHPGQSVERTIVGGESHTYLITLAAGQFVRVVVEQKGIDVALALNGPDGKPLVASDLTGTFGLRESLSYEAAGTGPYQLVFRANGIATQSGAYEIRLDVKGSASAQDRKRITAESLLNEAFRLLGQRQYADAKLSENLGRALTTFRELDDDYSQALTLNLMGRTHEGNAQYEKAIEANEQAISLIRGEKLRAGEARLLLDLAGVYQYLNRTDKMIQLYEQALEISRADKDRSGERLALTRLGSAYWATERLEKAIECFEQALAITRELKMSESQGLANLGAAYDNMGRYEKAIEYFEQALVYARETKQRGSEKNALISLAAPASKMGRWEKAIEYLEQALVVARETKSRGDEAHILNSIGICYENLGRIDKSIEYYEMTLAIQRELGHPDGIASALYRLAVRERTHNLKAARAYIEESLKITEAIRRSLMSPESRAAVSANTLNSYKAYSYLLMRQHQAEQRKGLDALAFETSEFQRARSLLDLLAEAGTDLRQGVDAALVERERGLGQQLGEKALLLTRAKPEQVETLKKEIGQLETDLERAQAAIRKASPHYAALTQPQPVKLSEIQAQLDADKLVKMHRHNEPPLELLTKKDVPPAIVDLIRRCLAKSSEHRPKCFESVENELLQILEAQFKKSVPNEPTYQLTDSEIARKALSFAALGNYVQAGACLDSVMQEGGIRPDLLAYKAIALASGDRIDDAREASTAALRMDANPFVVLLAHAQVQLSRGNFILLAVDSGMRRGEILKLRWSDFDFEQDKINIIGSHTKTERERDAPLSFRAKLALMNVRELYPAGERPFPLIDLTENVARSIIQRCRGNKYHTTAPANFGKILIGLTCFGAETVRFVDKDILELLSVGIEVIEIPTECFEFANRLVFVRNAKISKDVFPRSGIVFVKKCRWCDDQMFAVELLS